MHGSNGRGLTEQETTSTPAACCAAECLFEHVLYMYKSSVLLRAPTKNVRFVPINLTMHIHIWITSTYMEKSDIHMY